MVPLCTCLWILSFLSLLVPRGIKRTSIPVKGICTVTYDRWIICIPFIVLVAFDTAVLVAGLAGLMTHNPDSGTPWYSEMKATIMTKNMGPISQAFLRSGYLYYLLVFALFVLILKI